MGVKARSLGPEFETSIGCCALPYCAALSDTILRLCGRLMPALVCALIERWGFKYQCDLSNPGSAKDVDCASL
jgi:hypothetical protein